MTKQEAEYSLESDVYSHHMYKYICAPCLSEWVSLHTAMGNVRDLYHTMLSVIKDVRWWATYQEPSGLP